MEKYLKKSDVLKIAESTDYYIPIKNILSATPAAEVSEIRHGEWIEDKTYMGKDKKIYVCSLCNHWQSVKNHRQTNQIMYMFYCPFCGARMDIPQKQIYTFGFDARVVELAAQISTKKMQRANSRYIAALLEKWHELGLKSYDEVKAYEQSKKDNK